jgi:hypothetical protein
MENFIELIARHADIDTRRAMGFGDIDKRLALGFPPRKLVLPKLNLPFKIEESNVPNWCKCIDLPNDAILYMFPRNTQIAWVFGSRIYMGARYYGLNRDDGLVIRRNSGQKDFEYSRHPDFNEDGTLKNWQSL